MMSESEAIRTSKFLSLVLRHKPQAIGLLLDENGWADVPTLLMKLAAKGHRITHEQLRFIVETNTKKRFTFNQDESRIRATQGHSVKVNLGYVSEQPPELLYHGTAARFLDLIWREGLRKMNRHHVHLSSDKQTAHVVGRRHGEPVVLTVKAGVMAADGYVFYKSENGVWLTEHVPASYLVRD